MNISWVYEDKLTFIILDKLKWKRRLNKFFEDGNVIANLSPEVLSKITPFEEHSMIGDVNLYFSEDEDEGEDSIKFCEISIMIAEKDYKRKGYNKCNITGNIITHQVA